MTKLKLCQKCNKEIPPKAKANNVKYCEACREEVYKYKEYRVTWQRNARDAKAKRDTIGKIKCNYCKGYYKKSISHAWQVHGINERQYKDEAGLDHKKGIIVPETREILREHVQANYEIVVEKNLLQKGKRSRFRTGNPNIGKYERSPQTIERLKQQSFIKKSNRDNVAK